MVACGTRRTGALVGSGGQDGELHRVRRGRTGAPAVARAAAVGDGERTEAGDDQEEEERERCRDGESEHLGRRGAGDSSSALLLRRRWEERRPDELIVGGHPWIGVTRPGSVVSPSSRT